MDVEVGREEGIERESGVRYHSEWESLMIPAIFDGLSKTCSSLACLHRFQII